MRQDFEVYGRVVFLFFGNQLRDVGHYMGARSEEIGEYLDLGGAVFHQVVDGGIDLGGAPAYSSGKKSATSSHVHKDWISSKLLPVWHV